MRSCSGSPKPITMVVPFPPGGVADIVGRPLASQMEKTLKQPVVVMNRTGAGGAVGMASVAKAAPDGYTILMGLSSISIFPVSDRINGKTPSNDGEAGLRVVRLLESAEQSLNNRGQIVPL